MRFNCTAWLAAGMLVWAGNAHGAGKLAFSPATVDLGRVGQHQTIQRTITMQNVGDAALDLLGTKSDCECTSAKPAIVSLAPGEKGELKIRVESRVFLGELSRQVTVLTSSGDFSVEVNLNVAPLGNWDTEVYPFEFPPTAASLPGDYVVRLRHVEGARLLDVTPNVTWLLAAVEASADASQVIRLTKLATAPAGTRTALLRVRTSDSKQPTLSIPITVPVYARAAALPATLALTAGPAGGSLTGDFEIVGWTGKAPPRAELPGAEIAGGPMKEGAYRFSVSIRDPQVLGKKSAVRIFDGGKQVLTVPLELQPTR